MGDESGQVNWYEADPRGVLPFESFHIPHDLRRILKQNRFEVTLNRDFLSVIRGCSKSRSSTWITEDIIEAYGLLHKMGYAHSVEAWREGELAGGLYGVAVGGAFFGESMFFRTRDASKAALAHLAYWLMSSEFLLFDIQMVTDLLSRFGAQLISKRAYLQILNHAVAVEREIRPRFIDWKKALNGSGF